MGRAGLNEHRVSQLTDSQSGLLLLATTNSVELMGDPVLRLRIRNGCSSNFEAASPLIL